MEQLNRQVRKAQRRLIVQQFIALLGWCLFAALAVATFGVIAGKFWLPESIAAATWNWSWIGGALGMGLLASLVWTYVVRRDSLQAAVELDQRCGLKERVSSALSLSQEDRLSVAGQALTRDAVRRVERIDVSEHFRPRFSWRNALFLAPALAAFLIATLIDPWSPKQTEVAANIAQAEQVKNSAKTLQKKTAELRNKAAELGLEKIEGQLKKLEKDTQKLASGNKGDRKLAMLKLNDLSKSLEKRREEMASGKKMQQQFSRLKNLGQGPAEKMANALKNGNMSKAKDELNKLMEKLKAGSLSEKQKENLAKQLAQMQEKIQEMADAQKEAKENLKEKIEKLRAAGKLDEVAKAQEKLDKMEQQSEQMNKIAQMSQKLGECSKCMASGDGKGAMQALAALGEDLDSLSQQMAEMEMLDMALDQLADARNSMNCPQCNGAGCSACQAMGLGQGKKPGNGLGQGKGQGDRPEDETDTRDYGSRVRQKPDRGRQVFAGEIDGPNQKGEVLEGIKAEFNSGGQEQAEALTNQRLPRSHSDHAREYFQSFVDD